MLLESNNTDYQK